MKLRLLLCLGCSALLAGAPLAAAVSFHEVESFGVPTQARQLVYSPVANALVLRNTASEIVAIDLATKAATPRLAFTRFTDVAMSPSGRYVFGADYGGEHIGYGTPYLQSWVHRLDLTTMTWDTRTAYIAYNVQAVSDTQVILKSYDQWVSFTNNAWGAGPALLTLATGGGVFFGDFRYDVRTQRLLHGNSNLSSQEVVAWRLINNEFVFQETSGTYGSAQYYGGTVALATDGSAFYYGKLQVDALDVSHNLRVFPEFIYAATGPLAFGDGKYFDARTGALAGTLPFATTVYALNPWGDDFWAYDPATSTVHHFVSDAPATGRFYTVTPCRAVDTRGAAGPVGGPALSPGVRIFELEGVCGVPSDARGLAVNVTVVAPAADGDLRLFPAGRAAPLATAISFAGGRTRSNNSIVGVSSDGTAALAVQADIGAGAVHVVVDVVGYFR